VWEGYRGGEGGVTAGEGRTSVAEKFGSLRRVKARFEEGEVMGGAVMARRHPSCGAGGAVENHGDTAGVGRRGGEDEADSRGSLDKETRGRRPARKARTKRENVLP
jgi:hypothetical protein